MVEHTWRQPAVEIWEYGQTWELVWERPDGERTWLYKHIFPQQSCMEMKKQKREAAEYKIWENGHMEVGGHTAVSSQSSDPREL